MEQFGVTRLHSCATTGGQDDDRCDGSQITVRDGQDGFLPTVRRGLPGFTIRNYQSRGLPAHRSSARPPKRAGPLIPCVDTMTFMVRFNTDPLVAPLTPQEIHALKQRRARGEFGTPAPNYYVAITIGGVVCVCVQLLTVAGPLIRATTPLGEPPQFLWPLILLILGIAAICAAALFMVIRSHRRQQLLWSLLARFADANGMRFGIHSANPRYPGVLFNEGQSRASTFHLFSPTGVLADVGGYEYITGGGQNSSAHRWHFAAFRLPHPVPHLLLDAKANNMWKLTNLPKAFASSQRISLGEPFDSHYQLYAPEGYGRDAFQLLPPHVMDALLRTPIVYDIEMVDTWLFCYTQSQQDLTNPATWRLLETIANGVLGSLAPVVNRYSDSRALIGATGNASYGPGAPVQIAPQGTRLRRGVNVSAFIGLAIFLAYLIVSRLLGLPG